ncbi:MAG: corrinoid protein [Anaerolineales bacterium]|nr:corrinoid protein [Anaerolineales bacterium]
MDEKLEDLLQDMFDSIVDGDEAALPRQVQAALDAGLGPQTILNEGMMPAMAEVGRLFELEEYFVPEMLVAARAMQAGVNVLRPLLAKTETKPVARVLIGTVKGDVHDIGKNLVAMMLEGGGFEVRDIGIDAPPDRFIAAIQEFQPQIVGMSALLTTTMPNIKVTIDALQAAGLREQVKIMVGGAPLTAEFAQRVGADGYGADASRVVNLARALIGA